ncbi:hypothetical protein HZ326_18261 [Fusarium oxysporum f. sp. albedinis]|nr:hypothetical protein HZ326_18261 [Fusarium oxysporum f. sp. albedinis]
MSQRPLLLNGILSPTASRRVYARSLEVTDVCLPPKLSVAVRCVIRPLLQPVFRGAPHSTIPSQAKSSSDSWPSALPCLPKVYTHMTFTTTSNFTPQP